MKAMILAAGVGSRLAPYTKCTPKALIRVGDYPMIDLTIGYLKKYGVSNFIINVHHFADQLMEYVSKMRWLGYDIEISDETEELLNTGGGLKKASWFFQDVDNFVLMAVDVLTDLDLKAMYQQHLKSDALVTLAVKKRKTSRALLFDSDGELAGWKDNNTGNVKQVNQHIPLNEYGFSGIHIINSKIFNLMEEKKRFSIIDLYLHLAEKQKIMAYDHSNGDWLEFGRASNISRAVHSLEFNNLIKKIGM